jgi:hypothetical protein
VSSPSLLEREAESGENGNASLFCRCLAHDVVDFCTKGRDIH